VRLLHAKVAKLALPFSSSNGRQFSWEEVCTLAALETDHARIEERIRLAEQTLMAQLLELPKVPRGDKEMADDERERLESFRAFIKAAEEGALIPPVAEDDLRRLHEIAADMAKRRVGKDVMVGVDLMTRTCSPGTNLPTVWLRCTQLMQLIRQGFLGNDNTVRIGMLPCTEWPQASP
jgi:hypothetical protein